MIEQQNTLTVTGPFKVKANTNQGHIFKVLEKRVDEDGMRATHHQFKIEDEANAKADQLRSE